VARTLRALSRDARRARDARRRHRYFDDRRSRALWVFAIRARRETTDAARRSRLCDRFVAESPRPRAA